VHTEFSKLPNNNSLFQLKKVTNDQWDMMEQIIRGSNKKDKSKLWKYFWSSSMVNSCNCSTEFYNKFLIFCLATFKELNKTFLDRFQDCGIGKRIKRWNYVVNLRRQIIFVQQIDIPIIVGFLLNPELDII
jgi:hypothetical protein